MLLLTVIEMSKSYNSPVSGFVEDIIDSILFYVYENPKLKLSLRNQDTDIYFLANDSHMKKDFSV